jgi:hypothetical protein
MFRRPRPLPCSPRFTATHDPHIRPSPPGLYVAPAKPSGPSAAYAVGGNAQGFPRPRARHHGSLASMTRTPPLVPPPPAPPGPAGGGRQPPGCVERRRGPPGPRRLTRSEGTRKGSLDRGLAITAVYLAGEALQALGGFRGRRERARVPSTAGSPSRLARIHDAHPATGAPAARSAGPGRQRAAAAGLCRAPARPSRPSAAHAVGGNAQGFPRPRARHHGSLASMTRTPPLVPPPPAPPGPAGRGRQPPLRGGPAR